MTKTITEIFLEARDFIKSTFELELTLIEQVRLKQYVDKCLEEECLAEKELVDYRNRFDPYYEAASRFMTDYYGLMPLDGPYVNGLAKWNSTIESRIPFDEWYQKHKNDDVLDFDEKTPKLKRQHNTFFEYLKILQEKAHKP